LIKSYLNERHQKVLVNCIKANDNISSNWKEVKNGIPQGLILGQFCFYFVLTIYLKIAAEDTKIVLYGDDTNIIVTNLSPDGLKMAMNKIFIDMSKWFRTNLLSPNFKKKFIV
jgi:hypothetical protein